VSVTTTNGIEARLLNSDKQPVPAAKVYLMGPNFPSTALDQFALYAIALTETDSLGHFAFADLDSGTYAVVYVLPSGPRLVYLQARLSMDGATGLEDTLLVHTGGGDDNVPVPSVFGYYLRALDWRNRPASRALFRVWAVDAQGDSVLVDSTRTDPLGYGSILVHDSIAYNLQVRKYPLQVDTLLWARNVERQDAADTLYLFTPYVAGGALGHMRDSLQAFRVHGPVVDSLLWLGDSGWIYQQGKGSFLVTTRHRIGDTVLASVPGRMTFNKGFTAWDIGSWTPGDLLVDDSEDSAKHVLAWYDSSSTLTLDTSANHGVIQGFDRSVPTGDSERGRGVRLQYLLDATAPAGTALIIFTYRLSADVPHFDSLSFWYKSDAPFDVEFTRGNDTVQTTRQIGFNSEASAIWKRKVILKQQVEAALLAKGLTWQQFFVDHRLYTIGFEVRGLAGRELWIDDLRFHGLRSSRLNF